MATTPPTSTHHEGRSSADVESARNRTIEHLKQASDEIERARQEASGGVRSSLDNALERLHEVQGELRQRAQDQIGAWQEAIEQESDETRLEMGRFAVRAQRTPEALKELSGEIGKRDSELR
jgi:vacuolar-type H+-ATPase subunit H